MARVLIVEDQENLCAAVSYALRKDGREVYVAATGDAGLDLFLQERPELVLLDIMLPGLDGFAVLRRIRQPSRVPVLILSARTDEVDTVLGIELGADDYIAKPFRMRELLARVSAALRRAGLPPDGDAAGAELSAATCGSTRPRTRPPAPAGRWP